MSLQTGTNPTSRPYSALLEVYQAAGSSDYARTYEKFSRLPQQMQNRIFRYSCELQGRPQNVKYPWTPIDVFYDLRYFQSVIQRIAFEAFDSLDTGMRNKIAERVCAHAQDTHWGETILLQSLDDISDDSRTDLSHSEIEDIVDEWVSEDVSGEECRLEAEIRIMKFFKDPPIDGQLDLSELNLCSLPQIFHADVFTTRLIDLDLSFNKLQSLPEQIGVLWALQNLYVQGNQLQFLPEWIGQLRELKTLNISGNQLQSLPEQIGQLRALQYLLAAFNYLQSLPEQIVQLQALGQLSLSNNLLESLPERIGRLRALHCLDLENNPSLTVSPMQIHDLPSFCRINLSNTKVPQAVLEQLSEDTSSPDYSMENSEHSTEECSIESLMHKLFTLAEEPIREFPNLFNAEQETQVSLRSWLSRMSDKADCKNGGEEQKAFAGEVLGYMQRAEEQLPFREGFLLTLAIGNDQD